MPRFLPFVALVLALLPPPAVAAAAPAAPAPDLIQATDLLQLKKLESPVLSPDGRWVAYVVSSIEPKPGAPDDWVYASHLWLAATDGSTPPHQLTRTGHDSDPVWHPAGNRLAFVRTVGQDKPQIYVLPLAGGEAQPLTRLETGADQPRWSPDGERLLFTSALSFAEVRAALEKAGLDAKPKWKWEKPGRPANDTRIYPAKKAGAPAKPGAAPASQQPPSSPETPSNTEQAAQRPGQPDQSAAPLGKADGTLPERREWLAGNEADGNPRLLDRLDFLDEQGLNPELAFPHLFVQEAREGAAARDLTPGYLGLGEAEWMADGKGIVCTGPAKLDEHPDRSEHTSLYVVNAADGGVKLLAELKDYSLADPHPSPDGKLVALTATPGQAPGYGQAAVATVPVAGGEPRLLTEKLDRSAQSLRWSPDSRYIYFVVAANGGFPLYRVEPSGGLITGLTQPRDLGVHGYAVGRGRLVQVLTTPANPSELSSAISGEPDRLLTTHNSAWLAGKKLASSEGHTLVDREGLTVQFWTMKPTVCEAGKKYPLLLEIHGGPAAMWGPGEDTLWFEFQYFAARGYAIVYANPRGSGGYGYDFQYANHKDWGTGPAADILSAVDFAAKEPYVNRQREVLTGGSYGGYMTAWIIGHDHRFKAAVAQRGVYDLFTFFGEGNAWRLVPRVFGGYPWQAETRHVLERESPLTYVEAITTPLLLQHGDNDRRTGFVQSEMMFRSLKVLGRDVEAVRYPRATHEMSRSGEPKQRLDSLVRYEEFFRRYIGEN